MKDVERCMEHLQIIEMRQLVVAGDPDSTGEP